MSDLKKLGEFGLIERFRSRLTTRSPKVKVGIGDDCAVYASGSGNYQVVTTDALIESVHFDLSITSAKQLGRKALSVNISDIAAMGGVPTLALVTLGIPKKFPVKFLDGFYDGLNQICRKYKIELSGGDTVASPGKLFISITLLGEAKKGRLFLRQGARPGDRILVTGSLGESALGLKLLTAKRKKWSGSARDKKKLIRAHLDPIPRVAESTLLGRSRVRIRGMIDISDGLIQDLRHVCKAGGVGALINEKSLPRSPALIRVCSINQLNPLDFILGGGEDYELLFTLKAEDVKKILRQFQNARTAVTVIGEIIPASGKLVLEKTDGRLEVLAKSLGFNHFQPK
ncbi:MAG: thiamine-phosphate kinase [Nitrospinaceae bacterium]